MTTDSQDIINVEPTKEFFVEMLIRDAPLRPAILDLIDNCVDGALRLRSNDRFDGLQVDIVFDKNQFSISDNCGGIRLDIALNYAFRFGRPSDAEPLAHSVGRFGVGMKRALFKIGNYFEVDTVSEMDRFKVEVDVSEWVKTPQWEFPLTEVERFDKETSVDERGTKLTVNRLSGEALRQFSLQYFESTLINDISRRHQSFIDKGLIIRVNNQSIPSSQIQYLVGVAGVLQPANISYNSDGVSIRIIAGIADSNPREAGWYVYCNGRMILEADQTNVTGWGEPGMMARFHNQFSRFRGSIYFDSEDSNKLPWNTTKNGVDEDMAVFVNARRQMISLMRPAISFLNSLDREINDKPEGNRPMETLIQKAARSNISRLGTSRRFNYELPPAPVPPAERRITISYSRPTRIVDRLKRALKVRSARAVGEATFDYYIDQEGIDVTG